MAYSSVTSILAVNPDWPQTSTSGGYSATAALISSHIVRADNLINAKISNRYDVASFATNVPPMLISLSEDIATYYSYRSLYSNDNQNVNEWTEKYREAIDILTEIRDGDMDLVNTAGSVIIDRTDTPITVIDSTTIDYQPFFDEDEPLDWKVSKTKLDDIGEGRS